MQQYSDNSQDLAGNARAAFSVTVKQNGSLATIYSDNGVTTTTNPVVSDGDGVFSFYAPDGKYTLEWNGGSKNVYLYDSSGSTGVNVKTFGCVGDGVTNDTVAFQRALNQQGVVIVPEGDYLLSAGITWPTATQIISEACASATGTGYEDFPTSRLIFTGTGPAGIVNQDTTVFLNECALKGITITTTPSAQLDYVVDIRGPISLTLENLRIENRWTGGGFRSRALVSDATTWLNRVANVEIRVDDAATKPAFDVDWSDSSVHGGAFTGGTGSFYRGPGNFLFNGVLFDRSTGYGLTLSKELTSNGTVSVVGSYLDANTIGGIKVTAANSPGGTIYIPTITGCGFRNPGATYDIVFDSTNVSSLMTGPIILGNSFSETGPKPISVDTTKWFVQLGPNAYANTAWVADVFGDTRSTLGVVGREGINLQGPIFGRVSRTFRSSPNVAAAFGVDTDASPMALLGAIDGLSPFLYASRKADGTATDLLFGTDNTARLRLASDGSQFRPDTDAVPALGAPTFNWNGVYSKFFSLKSGTAPTLGTGQGAALWYNTADSLLKAKLSSGSIILNPQWVNLLDYATGNGTDETTGIQAAITAAYGKTLWVPPGTFKFTTLSIAQGLTIRGVAGQSVLQAHSTKPLSTNLVVTASANAPTRDVVNLYIDGIVFDGGSLAPQRWLQAGPGGATITDPIADYYDAALRPAAKIGNPAFPTWTIADTAAANRRNTSYTQVSALLKLNLVDGATISNCLFRNHKGWGIYEAGGRNIVIERNGFDAIGKNDGPYHAVYTQSFGTPGGGAPSYQSSENIAVRNNWARNLERSFILFAPTKGGICENNYIDGWGESCIFSPDNINYDGGRSVIRGNRMKNGTLTDIVCYGIEAGGSFNLTIENNVVEGAVTGAITSAGGVSVRAFGNTFKDNCTAITFPYGPFSERYAFGVGTPWVAGTTTAITSLSVITVGSIGAVGCNGVLYRDNEIIESRVLGSYPYVVRQTKSGSNYIASTCVIEGGRLDIPGAMPFLDTSVGQVWDTNIPFSIRNIAGHASESPVVIDNAFPSATTGTVTISPGFRPRMVQVFAADSTAADGRIATGAFTWNTAATRNDFSLSHEGVSGTGQVDALYSTDVVRFKDTAAVVKFLLEFVNWTETGFVVNVITSGITVNARFVCTP